MPDSEAPLILLVNDDEIGRYAVGRTLKQSGFDLLEAATGQEALDLVQKRPDLVLLDVNLPDISGLEVCRCLKSDPATEEIPVLHVSATFIDSESQVRGLEGGADGYLTYPLEPPVLVATIRAHLRIGVVEAQRRELAMLLEDVNDAIIVADDEGVITRWNRGAERIYGWTEGDAIGELLWEVLPPSGSAAQQGRILDQLQDLGRWEGEARHRHRDGSEVFVLSSLTLVRHDETKPAKIVAVNRDVSEQRKVELERIELVEELKLLNSELERRVEERTTALTQANRTLTSRGDELEALVYSISHDVRAPLRGIDGFSNVLLQDYESALDETGKHYLQRIVSGARHMGELIDHLLQLSRLSRRRISMQSVDLSSMALDLMQKLQAENADRTLNFTVQENLEVEGDEDLLRTLLYHLLDNAVKFTAQRETANIEFGTETLDDDLVFFVRDNGVGFDPAYGGKLFTAFQRLHPPREYSGTGIGLATVRRIVNRHGGSVWAESTPGEGAIFHFTLPRPPDAAELRD